VGAPLRAAVTVESHPRYVGAQFFPHLNLDVNDVAGFGGWNLGNGHVTLHSRSGRFETVIPRCGFLVFCKVG
jgi:hypothetical protein